MYDSRIYDIKGKQVKDIKIINEKNKDEAIVIIFDDGQELQISTTGSNPVLYYK
ncbi:MAG: hypothetical protein ACM3KR_00605 [Deltaproteobacteria bacterium]